MNRRQFLGSSATLMGAIPFVSMTEQNLFNPMYLADAEVYKTRLGKFTCTIFKDRVHQYVAQRYFSNAAPEELDPALARYHITRDNIPSPFISVLLQQGDKNILIDTGLGFSKKPVGSGNSALMLDGRVQHLLQQEKIKSEAITDVILTHLHPDHIGGIYSDEGQLLFPNARFHIHEDEWNFWYSPQSDKQPAQFRYFIDKNVNGLKTGNLHLIKGNDVSLLPGITAIKAEGHTPGQIALLINSGKENLLYISDAFLHPLHIERLDWQTNYDLDHDKAKQTRIKLLEMAYKDNMLVNAFHFDFPGLGRVDKFNNGWTWKYSAK